MFVHVQFPQRKVKYEIGKELQALKRPWGNDIVIWEVNNVWFSFHKAWEPQKPPKSLDLTKCKDPFTSLGSVSQCYTGSRAVVPVHFSMNMSTFSQKAPFNSLQTSYDPFIFSVSPWSVVYYLILRPDHAKIHFSLKKKNVARKSLVFFQYFTSRMDFHSSETNFTLGTANPTGPLRCIYNPLRCYHLGHFEHMSTYLFRWHFKTSLTMGQWCWWWEISPGVSFLAGGDGNESAHSSRPSGTTSCCVESSHLNGMGQAEEYHGTQGD